MALPNAFGPCDLQPPYPWFNFLRFLADLLSWCLKVARRISFIFLPRFKALRASHSESLFKGRILFLPHALIHLGTGFSSVQRKEV